MWLKFEDVASLGITPQWIRVKVKSGEWESRETGERGRNGKEIREVNLESLPHDLQMKWIELHKPETPNEIESSLTTESIDTELKFLDALLRYPAATKVNEPDVRGAFQTEAIRLAQIVERYDLIEPKRFRTESGKLDFVQDVYRLCDEAICRDAVVLSKEPKRAKRPSPMTLDGWSRKFKTEGLLTFIRSKNAPSAKKDRRKARISAQAVEWLNTNWRKHPSPYILYSKLEIEAKKKGWTIPSSSYVYRKYKSLPKIVSTITFKSKKEYQSKLAPYVPRDFIGLEALQVLCGDHSVRDVSVVMPDGTLARPWWTVWLDLRTYTIWGWHLDVVPSSQTIGLAYANGVRNFGAQPIAQPDRDFYSYLYTDQGRDYRCKNLNGRELVFKKAAKIDGAMQMVCTHRKVGLMDELNLKHLMARGYNAREKPVERIFKDFSAWEENQFEIEYCGRDAKVKPENWVNAWHKHAKLQKKFKNDLHVLLEETPFFTFDEYREALAGRIHQFNTSVHTRKVLGGRKIIPLDELNRLYTPVKISEEALEILLLKPRKGKIGKDGVNLFQANWHFLHPEMSEHKGEEIEIRYSDGDWSQVWAILPATDRKPQRIVRAELVTPSPLLNPNKRTMEMVAKQAAHEQKVVRDFSLLNQSTMRGENVFDRVAAMIEPEEVEQIEIKKTGTGGSIHQLTRYDAPKIRDNGRSKVSTEQVESAEVIDIFGKTEKAEKPKIKDEWEED